MLFRSKIVRNPVGGFLPQRHDALLVAFAYGVDEAALEVDFATGLFRNLTRNTERQYEALPETLLDVIRIGGWEANFRNRLARQRSGA